jgi:EmrB/QacA subfamily drug resistance transporter
MEFLDGSIITTALPHMAVSLGTTPVALEAAVSIYLLTVAIFILPSGWMADRFGPRPVFTGAIILFTASSVLCGLAESPNALVAARAIQGIGGAMMVPVGRLVVLRATAKPDLMRAIAILTWPALTAPLLGPPLGGFLSEYLSWRWIFFINVPLAAIGVALALRLMPTDREVSARPFDFLGFILAGTLCFLAMSGLSAAGNDPSGPWIVGIVCLAGCFAVGLAMHVRHHAYPIIDPGPFIFQTFRAALAGGTVMRILISAVPFLLPLLFQLGFGLDAVHAGLFVLALFVGNILIKPATSAMLRRAGFRSVLVINGLVQASTMVGCAYLDPKTPPLTIVALLVLSGASRSLQFTALNTLAFADVPKDAMSAANTLFSVAFQMSLGVGVALGAALIRLSTTLAGTHSASPMLADFRFAFLALTAMTVLAALNHARLPMDAGAAVSAHRASR